MEGDTSYEFLEANRGYLEAIMSGIESRLAADSDRLIIQEAHTQSEVIHGDITPEMVMETIDGLSEEEADEIADVWRRKQLAVAEITLVTLKAFVDMKRMADLHDSTDADKRHLLSAADLSPLAYSTALFQTTEWGYHGIDTRISLVKTQLNDVSGQEFVTEYDIAIEDSELVKRLSIVKLHDKLEIARLDTKMSNDPLIRRVIEVLGGDKISKLLGPLGGMYRDDEELDEILSTIWLECQGTAQEDIAAPLLDEVRTRSIAAKDAFRLSFEFKSHLPSIDQLQEFLEILE